jgi:hypothetical protein
MAELTAPVLIKPLPSLNFYENKPFGPIDLNEYVQSPNPESGKVRFYSEIADTGAELPSRIICMESGLFGGIAERGTKGQYKIVILAENESLEMLVLRLELSINELPAAEDPIFFSDVKEELWSAVGKDLPAPASNEALTRPISPAEVYYLVQRFGSMTIWDVYNLEAPNSKVLLALPGVSKHYNVYDRGCCLVGAPKSLFNHERTLSDAIQTAKVMAKEVYKRGWTIEFGGFNKMVRAAWIELQVLGDKFNKPIEIMHYQPSERDLDIFQNQVEANRPTP